MPDGSLVQTLEGAYPGSILSGPDLHMDAPVPHDYNPPQINNRDAAVNRKSKRSTTFTGQIVFLSLAVGVVVALRRRRFSQRFNLPYRYEELFQADDLQSGYETGGSDNSTSYVELASTQER
jgi:hypothetical protein